MTKQVRHKGVTEIIIEFNMREEGEKREEKENKKRREGREKGGKTKAFIDTTVVVRVLPKDCSV